MQPGTRLFPVNHSAVQEFQLLQDKVKINQLSIASSVEVRHVREKRRMCRLKPAEPFIANQNFSAFPDDRHFLSA